MGGCMRHRSFYVPKSRVIMLAVALAILLAGTAQAVPALPAQQQQPSKAKPEPKKEKKVWTDENIGELGGKSRVSVVGRGPFSIRATGSLPLTDHRNAGFTAQLSDVFICPDLLLFLRFGLCL